MNPFAERYKTLKDGELLAIVNDPEGFQELAVEAARAELERRNLSDKDREKAIAEAADERKKRLYKDDRKQFIADKVRSVSSTVLGSVSPVQTSSLSTDREIIVISVFIALTAAVNIYAQAFQFAYLLEAWDISTFFFVFEVLYVGIAAFLFWRRVKAGWIMTASVISFYVVEHILRIITDILYPHTGLMAALDQLLPPESPLFSLGKVILWLAFLWVICKPAVRAVYAVDKKLMWITLSVVIVLTLGRDTPINALFVIFPL